ncbi:uncharacterized protein METZ01_LOCUS212801 [marine metagenome]|uniref:Uncharacterized protein n=1 Tax=marine metagenome TaxID=408172 RepID=A0A382FCV0_9ZZZZ
MPDRLDSERSKYPADRGTSIQKKVPCMANPLRRIE